MCKEKTRRKSSVKKSLRQLNKEFRQSTIAIDRLKNVTLIVDNSFEIGKNMDTLTGDEACFYTDQLSSRCGRISEDVDLKYVTEKQTELELAQAALKRDMCEESYISEVDVEPSVSSSNDGRSTIISTNRSGLVRLTKNHSHFAVQCCLSNRPSVRTVRNFTDTIKNTLCEISVKCNLSLEASRLAFKTACGSFYGHDYFLSKDEAIQNQSELDLRTSLSTSSSSPLSIKPPKRSRLSSFTLSEAAKNLPHTTEEWKIYEFVLPSTRTLTDHKQFKAVQHENQAAMALYTKPDNIKSILHFDATSRSKIDGDWPSLILVFSDNRRYSLRPLFFAFEDRQNIVRLIVETYKRLASSIKISSQQEPVKPVQLWQNTTSIMTDSVNKNLKIGEEVTKVFK